MDHLPIYKLSIYGTTALLSGQRNWDEKKQEPVF